MDKQFASLENSEGFMGITAGGNIIHSKLLMKTQWHVLVLISNWSVRIFEAHKQIFITQFYT